MKKAIVVLTAIIVVGGLALVLVIVQRSSMHRIELPLVEPARNPTAQTSQAFPQQASTVSLTVRIPIAKVTELAEATVPTRFRNMYEVPDTAGIKGIRVSPDLTRSALGLKPVVGSDPPRVLVDSELKGQVGVKARKPAILKLPRLAPKDKPKSPDIEARFDVDAQIRGWIEPGIDSHWAFTHRQEIEVDVDKASTKLFGIVPISLAKELQKAVDELAPKLADKALDAVRDKMPIRKHVEAVWLAMFKPTKISANPDTYVLLTPRKIRLEGLRFDDREYLVVRLAVDGLVQTIVADQPLEGAKPTPLPDLVQEPAIDPKFHVLLPVGVELSAINPKLTELMAKSRIELEEGNFVLIKELSLFSEGESLFARLKIEGENAKESTRVTGTVFLKCGLAVSTDPPVLRLKDVDFCVESQSLLIESAAWLRKDVIARKLEEKVQIDLTRHLTKLRNEFNSRYASLDAGPFLKVALHLDTVGFQGAKVSDNFIIVGFDISGEMNGEIVFKK